MESFEHMGYWWLPQEPNASISGIPETAIPGKLSFDPVNGGMLELLGNLDTEDPYGIHAWKKFEIIQGFVSNSEKCVTLHGCYVTSISLGSTISETRLIVNCIFTGYRYWFDSVEDMVFERLSVGYTYLNDWMFQKNFTRDFTHENYKRMLTYDVRYVSPDPIEITLDKAKIEIAPRLSNKSSIAEVSLTNEYRITITPQEKWTFDDYIQLINFHMPNFLTLATGHTNFPLNLAGLVSEDRGGMSIFFQVPRYVEKRKSITLWPMLFTFEDIRDDLPKYLSNWISKSDMLRPVTEQFFYVRSHKNLALEMKFLSLTRALEGYHRIVCGGAYLTPEEYKPVKEALIDAIPSWIKASHRDKLKGMLQFGYQFSLHKRLEDICIETLGNCAKIAEELIGKPKVFARKVTNLRNVLTHPDIDTARNEISPSDLFDYVRKMQMLLRICFLKEMEFPPNEITRLLNENQEYQNLTEKKEP